MTRRAAALALAAGVLARADPLACQSNDAFPMLPIYHIIGNVSVKAGGGLAVEPINDASGVTFYEGLYHVWHQCCQNHWDHLITKDLVHFQRLPPPIQPLGLKTWDGSITMLPAAAGGPVILYDAQDGKAGSHGQDARVGGRDSPIVGVARLADPADHYLQTWTRADDNPVVFAGAPIAFPGPIWANGDHFNFVGQGNRFQSNGSSAFHSWANMGPFVGRGEVSGQWWFPIPGAPAAGSPNRAVNVGNGADFLLGTYDAANESFTPFAPTPADGAGRVARLESGGASWFGASGGADNNGRAMMIGWATPDFEVPGEDALTRLTLLREISWDAAAQTLVSNPVPELVGLRAGVLAHETAVPLAGGLATPHAVPGTAGGAAASADVVITFSGVGGGSAGDFGVCVLSNGTAGSGLGITFGVFDDYYMPGVDIPGGDYNVTDVRYSDPHVCQRACTADGPKCVAYTYVTRPPLVGSCCLKSTANAQRPSATCTSGIKAPQPGALMARVGACGVGAGAGVGAAAGAPAAIRARADGTVTVRITPDRSLADFFVNGGAFAGTAAWPVEKPAVPRAAADSTVLAWASGARVTADVDVWSMGCGWADPSYTEHPTM